MLAPDRRSVLINGLGWLKKPPRTFGNPPLADAVFRGVSEWLEWLVGVTGCLEVATQAVWGETTGLACLFAR